MLKALYWWQHIISLLKAHMSKNIKIRLSRGESWLWSSPGWRGPTAEYYSHNIQHTSGITPLLIWAGALNNRQTKGKWPESLQKKTEAMTEAALEWQVWKADNPSIKFILCQVRGLGMFTPLVCTGELLIYSFLPPCITCFKCYLLFLHSIYIYI